MKKVITAVLLLVLVSCKKQEVANPAETIYFGGDIITMEGNDAVYAEAIAVKDGKIIFVGTKSEADKFHGVATEMKDLEGKTLLPGFIDSHSHLAQAMNIMGQANLSSPPVGGCKNIADMIAALQKCKKDNNIKDGEWIFGWGYDETQIAEKRHPTKMDLDKYFPNNPVWISHVSSHMGVANSMALADGKIDANTPDKEGGFIMRLPNSKEPAGLLQEMAIHHFVDKVTEVFSSQQAGLLNKALDHYIENGITTVQEGFTDAPTIAVLKQASKENKLNIDVVALPGFVDFEKNLKDTSLDWGKYNNHLKFEGTKIISDGSPQGKTAFFTKPFLTPVPGCDHDCKGFPNVSQEVLNNLFTIAYKNKNQLFIHCSGDASMDMVLLAHETACKATGQPLDADRRTVIIHSHFVRKDQLEKYKKYKISPSFFTNHAYFWGDAHVANLGEERAFFLSPIHTADSMGIIYTNHTDYTITPINQLFTVWSAVNRVSRSGKIIGANERATAYQGLKAITINGAYQYFEEKTKGSLKEGKLADLVILDKNPLKVDKMKIKDILVFETIKEGKSVYKKEK
jgi:predicted amidohydrolase YtcJ